MKELNDLNDLLEELDATEQIQCIAQSVDKPIIYNKIYARVKDNGIVIHFFSQAFEKPTNTDVCIDETNVDRHGAQKYKVTDENGLYNYAIVNGQLVKRDKSGELERKEKIEYIETEIERLKEYLNETDYVVIKIYEAQVCGNGEEAINLNTQYNEVILLRQKNRARINELEEQLKSLN